MGEGYSTVFASVVSEIISSLNLIYARIIVHVYKKTAAFEAKETTVILKPECMHGYRRGYACAPIGGHTCTCICSVAVRTLGIEGDEEWF